MNFRHISSYLAGLSLLVATSTQAYPFSNLYFLGDSLTDMGNLGDSPYTTPGGATWAKWLADHFGIGLQPSNQGGTDYARAGDQTGSLGPINPNGLGGVVNQVSLLLANSGGRLNSQAAYFLWAGGNDFNQNVIQYCLPNSPYFTECLNQNFTAYDANKIMARADLVKNTAVSNLVDSVNRLHHAGAKYIFVNNLPELGLTPGGRELAENDFTRALAQAFAGTTSSFNQQLSQQISALPYDVVQVDIYNFLNYVVNHPGRFGFVNVTDEWAQNSSANPDSYLFYDQIHPTNIAHQAISDLIYYGYIVGPTYYGLLASVPFNTMTTHTDAIALQMQPYTVLMEKPPLKSWTIFATGSYSPSKTPGIENQAPFKSSNENYTGTMGAHYRFSERLLLGAALTPSHLNLKVDGLYQAQINELIGSLFGQYEHEQSYVNAVLSFGIPDVSDIKRTVPILQTEFVSAPNNTTGRHFGAQANAGIHLIKKGNFATGPFAGLDYQHLKIHGYNEAFELTASNLNFFDQTNAILTSTLGWQLNLKSTHLSKPVYTQVYGSLKTQHLGQDRDIRLETANVPGSHGAIPASGPRGSYGNVGAAITTFLHKNLGLTFSAQTNFGNPDFNQQIYSLTASLLF